MNKSVDAAFHRLFHIEQELRRLKFMCQVETPLYTTKSMLLVVYNVAALHRFSFDLLHVRPLAILTPGCALWLVLARRYVFISILIPCTFGACTRMQCLPCQHHAV